MTAAHRRKPEQPAAGRYKSRAAEAAKSYVLTRKKGFQYEKITALLLALVMALSLAACGSKDDSKQLVGTWQCALDLTKKMDEEMAANLGTEYTSEAPVSLYLTTVFNEDGTFSMSPDLDATTESLNAYIQALKPALVELLYKEAEDRGMTRDEFDSALADSGLTVESQVDSVLALFDVSTLLSDVESELDSGKYKLEDGRLYLAETDGSFTQADSIGCTVSGSTMQWTDDQGALADLETELGVSPDLSWTKQ